MKFSGINFRSLPTVSGLSFKWDDLSLPNGNGSSVIGFSGEQNSWAVTFKSGKIYDSSWRLVGTYNPSEGINVRGEIAPGFSRLFIGDSLASQRRKSSIKFSKWFINTTGEEIYVSPQISITGANYSFNSSDGFLADGSLDMSLSNGSDSDFRVFGTSYLPINNDAPSFDYNLTGIVAPTGLSFSIPSINPNLNDGKVGFSMLLDTSIGTIEKTFNVTRSGSITGDFSHLSMDGYDSIALGDFKGSGGVNSFVYDPNNSGINQQIIKYTKLSANGLRKDKSFTLVINSSVSGTGYYTGVYPTGHVILNSGFYDSPPVLEFPTYNHITGISFNSSNLFSVGCGSSIPAVFTLNGGLGSGASGNALLKKVRISLYGSKSFYTITGFDARTPGTGYNYNPFISLATNSECFDVPLASGNQFIYTPFVGSGLMKPDAAYLHGEPTLGTSVRYISGAYRTGWGLTGVIMTNPGSGYSSGILGRTPTYKITSSDLYSSIAAQSGFNASGSFIFNSKKEPYSLLNNWAFKTGSLGGQVTELLIPYINSSVGYSGQVSLPANEDGIVLISYAKNLPIYTGSFIGIPSVSVHSFSSVGSLSTSGDISGVVQTDSGSGAFFFYPVVRSTGDYYQYFFGPISGSGVGIF